MGPIAAIALLVTSSAAAASDEAEGPPVACPELVEEIRDVLHRSDVVQDGTATVRLARAVVPSAGQRDLLQDARNACREVVEADRRTWRLPAVACIAEASARLAELGVNPRDNHAQAYCGYDLAAALAQRASIEDDGMRASIEEGRAVALLVLAGLDARKRQRLTEDGIEAYEMAIQILPTAARQFTLGRVYLDRAEVDKADKRITAGAKLQPKGLQTALALIDLADLKRANQRPLDDVLKDLERARKAAPTSVATNGAIGVVLYDLGKYDKAREAFEAVISDDMIDDEGQSPHNYRAEAYYHLALLDARTAETTKEWQAVVTNAEHAVQAGAAEYEHRRLVCLSHIARGGPSVRDGGGAAWCESLITPEGQLLRGMFYLRQAQYVPRFRLRNPPGATEERYRALLARAGGAFERGLAALEARKRSQMVELAGLKGQTDLMDTLMFGQELVDYASSLCRAVLLDNGQGRERALFERYRTVGCDEGR